MSKDLEVARMMETGDNVEIAFASLTDEKNRDEILRKLEEKLGAVYVNAYKEACEKYMDEVEFARIVVQENEMDRKDKATSWHLFRIWNCTSNLFHLPLSAKYDIGGNSKRNFTDRRLLYAVAGMAQHKEQT